MSQRLAVVAGIILTLAVGYSGEKDDRADLPQHNTSHQARDGVLIVLGENHAEQSSPHEDGTHNEPPHWYAMPEWWLCILGIPSLLVLGWQTNESRRAANAAKDAARAALKNTEAVMLAERAWITVLPHVWSPEFYPLWEQGDPVPLDANRMLPFFHRFAADIKNVGKTPATIDSVSLQFIRIQSLSGLRAEPDFGDISPQNGYFAEPGNEPLIISAFLSPNQGTISKSEFAEICDGKAFLYAYGVVRYHDVHGSGHETRFGYAYHRPQGGAVNFEKAGFRRDGPKAYNRTT
jgi:hypothetical protein